MSMARHITLLLAMAIVAIAVSLAPSSAQAHGGRDHAAVSSGSTAHVAQSAMTRAVAVVAEAAADCDCPACAAGGHHGSCCFASGLAPAGLAATLPPMASTRAPSHALTDLAGIVPEALAEPPRPFA